MAIPGFQELFESRINNYFLCTIRLVHRYTFKNYFIPIYVCRRTILVLICVQKRIPGLRWCYVTYQSKSPHVLCHVFSRRARFGFFRLQSQRKYWVLTPGIHYTYYMGYYLLTTITITECSKDLEGTFKITLFENCQFENGILNAIVFISLLNIHPPASI